MSYSPTKLRAPLHAAVPALALLVAACGHHSGSANAPAAASPASAARPAAAAAAQLSALPQADADTPEGAYVALTSGAQLMFLYEAYSGLPPDFERMAADSSSEYRGTSDSFRKHDLLEALKTKYTAQIADAKAHPYVSWDAGYVSLGPYDFQRKGFPLNDGLISAGGYGYMNDMPTYRISFSNAEAARFLPEADENQARTIETVRTHRSIQMKLYAFVQSADDTNGRIVHAQIVKLQLFDPSGHQLLLERQLSR